MRYLKERALDESMDGWKREEGDWTARRSESRNQE